MAGYDQKPVLVGMNNPYRSEPEYALYPYPERSAGGRLYEMFVEAHERAFNQDVPGHRHTYLNAFDRRNVLSLPKWTAAEARRQGAALVRALPGRRVVVLGRQTAKAMGLPITDWFEPRTEVVVDGDVHTKLTFWLLPHPSGMNQMYNDPAVRARAGDLLLTLHQQTGLFGDRDWRL
jgi:hypothetical protein